MSKIIVTHKHPDLDAIMSVWLLLRFDRSQFGDSEIVVIEAGSSYKGLPVDSDSDVVHVDVGWGRFDHHQPGRYGTCAARLVFEDLIARGLMSPTDSCARAMIEHVNEIDVFADCYYPEASEARFAFTLSEIIPALHRLQIHSDVAVVRMMLVFLDGVYQRLKDYREASLAIEKGWKFECKWGKGVVVMTGADDVSKAAQKLGFDLVLVRDLEKKRTAIKISPRVEYPLDDLYAKICELDDPSRWFYHNSGKMLMNGSTKGKVVSPTALTLEKIVEIIKTL